MQLNLQSQKIGDVVIVRCQGRITVGAEVAALQQELEKLTVLTKKVVLQLGEVSFLDSVGLGALVRQLNTLRARGGDLRLCRVPPILMQILQVTTLLRIFPIYETEDEAVLAFSKGTPFQEDTLGTSKTRIVCIDSSPDLLSYLSALLKRSGYEVMTTRNPSDAQLFIKVTRPHLLICGPGIQANQTAMNGFSEIKPKLDLLLLPPDFSTSEAGQAGTDLVNRLRSILPNQA
jgi:anti-sigma B factor antagonist